MVPSRKALTRLVGLLALLLPAVVLAGEFRSRGVQVQLVGAAEALTDLSFQVNDVTIKADSLPKGERAGPTVRVFSSPRRLRVEGTWRQAGEERSWSGSIEVLRGRSVVLEIGGAPDGVAVVQPEV